MRIRCSLYLVGIWEMLLARAPQSQGPAVSHFILGGSKGVLNGSSHSENLGNASTLKMLEQYRGESNILVS